MLRAKESHTKQEISNRQQWGAILKYVKIIWFGSFFGYALEYMKTRDRRGKPATTRQPHEIVAATKVGSKRKLKYNTEENISEGSFVCWFMKLYTWWSVILRWMILLYCESCIAYTRYNIYIGDVDRDQLSLYLVVGIFFLLCYDFVSAVNIEI